jgi:hypothetical protein
VNLTSQDAIESRKASEGRGVLRLERLERCTGCDTDCSPATMRGLRCAGCNTVICEECAYRECVLCGKSLGLHHVCDCRGKYQRVPTWKLCARCPRSKRVGQQQSGTFAVEK